MMLQVEFILKGVNSMVCEETPEVPEEEDAEETSEEESEETPDEEPEDV